MGFPKIQFLGVSCLNQILLGNALHLAEDFPNHLVNDVVKKVHCVAGGAVTLCLLSGLAVADLADSGRFVHGTIPQAAVFPAGGQIQPCTTVTAEHIARQQGLSLGVLGNRRTFLCTVRPILPDFLRGSTTKSLLKGKGFSKKENPCKLARVFVVERGGFV